MAAPFDRVAALRPLLSPLLQSGDELPLVHGSAKRGVSAEWVNDLMETVLRGYVGDRSAVRVVAQTLQEDTTPPARNVYCESGRGFRRSGHLMAPVVGAACDCLADPSTCARVLPSTDFPASARSKSEGIDHRIEPMTACSSDKKLGLYLWGGFATGIAIALMIALIVVCTKRRT